MVETHYYQYSYYYISGTHPPVRGIAFQQNAQFDIKAARQHIIMDIAADPETIVSVSFIIEVTKEEFESKQ